MGAGAVVGGAAGFAAAGPAGAVAGAVAGGVFGDKQIGEAEKQSTLHLHATTAAVVVSGAVHNQTFLKKKLGEKNGGTCYAHACATVLRAAEGRIVGRKVMEFDDLVAEIAGKYGSDGAHCTEVLKEYCPPRRLRYQEVGEGEAERVLAANRAICASFALSKEGWNNFSAFFRNNPNGCFPPDQVPDHDGGGGHAVTLCGQTKEYWKFKNSWGDGFGDGGYFRISKSAAKKMRFHYLDVYFLESDLSEEDRNNFAG